MKGTYKPSPQIHQPMSATKKQASGHPLHYIIGLFLQKAGKMRERTSSRGVYFGHYKAAAEDNILLNLQYLIAEIPF